MFVDWRDKIDIMLYRTFNFFIFSFRDILHTITNYQLSLVHGNKDINYLIVHVLRTRRNLKLPRKLFQKLHSNLTFYQS